MLFQLELETVIVDDVGVGVAGFQIESVNVL
jgi:hypothetical protein